MYVFVSEISCVVCFEFNCQSSLLVYLFSMILEAGHMYAFASLILQFSLCVFKLWNFTHMF
jgi:hypothetical protein